VILQIAQDGTACRLAMQGSSGRHGRRRNGAEQHSIWGKRLIFKISFSTASGNWQQAMASQTIANQTVTNSHSQTGSGKCVNMLCHSGLHCQQHFRNPNHPSLSASIVVEAHCCPHVAMSSRRVTRISSPPPGCSVIAMCSAFSTPSAPPICTRQGRCGKADGG
jgi:hypothetical protein